MEVCFSLKFFLGGLGNWHKDLELIKNAVVEADTLDFYGALMPDHYMWGIRDWSPVAPDDYVTLETWVTLTYLAAKTEQIHLGTLVTPIPFRSPQILAKMLSTLDILSNGRVLLGVGAGWSKEEFEGYSKWDKPKIRVDKTKEGLELMMKLWTEKEVTHNGEFYQTRRAVLDPKPLQKPYPKLLFGGRGDRMLRLAGRYGDICYIISRDQTVESYERDKKKVLDSAERVNRKDQIAFMSGPLGSRKPYDTKECMAEVESAVNQGAAYFLISFLRNKDFIKTMRKFADEVMPSFI
jgi:alkanesulfonate monooxygenase SsuD/methylene tetrahydromethanopterin reductase-like flavin-dependent oxidoreductase (luciferase family)